MAKRVMDEEERKRDREQRRAAYNAAQSKWDELGISDIRMQNGAVNSPGTVDMGTRPTAGGAMDGLTGSHALMSSKTPGRQDVLDAGKRMQGAGNSQDAFSIGANTQMYRENTYDLEKLTNEDVVGIATRIIDDDERNAFIKAYRTTATSKKSANYQTSVPTLTEFQKQIDAGTPFGVYSGNSKAKAGTKSAQTEFASDSKNRQNMKTLGELYDADGRSININTADFGTVVMGIRCIADKSARDRAVTALYELTRTKGSRFYGQTLDKELAGTYMASPEFTEKDFKTFVSDFDGAFWPQSGHEEENERTYLDFAASIEDSGYTPAITRQLRGSLDAAYRNTTGRNPPDMSDVDDPAQAAQQGDGNGAQQGDGGEKTSGGSSILDTVIGALTKNAQPYGFRDKEDSAVDAVSSASARRESSEKAAGEEEKKPGFFDGLTDALGGELTGKPEETQQVPQEKGAGGGISYRELGKTAFAGMSDTLPPLPGYTPQRAEGPEQQVRIDLSGDPAAAVIGYVMRGNGNLLTEETQKQVQALYESSPGIRAVLGVMDDREVRTYLEQLESGDPMAAAQYNEAMRAMYLGDASYIIGDTLSRYAQDIFDESFPEALRADAAGVLFDVMRDAERAQAEGQIAYDPREETLYDAYLREHTDALDTVQDAFAFVDEEKKKQEEAKKKSAEQAEKDAEQRREEAMARLQTGMFTPQDAELLTDELLRVRPASVENDADYQRIRAGVRQERSLSDTQSGGWYNEAAADFLMGCGLDVNMDSADALIYKDMLEGYAMDALTQDTRAAYALGYDSLGAYYRKIGVTDEQARLHTRAMSMATQMGQSLSEDIVDGAMRAAFYTGSGDVSTGYAIGAGVGYGLTSTTGDYLEAIWTVANVAQEDRPSETTRLRREYVNRYGYAMAAYMYEQDMLRAADNGEMVSEELAGYVRRYIASGNDPFRMAIDPHAESMLRSAAATLDRRAEGISAWAQQNLTGGQGKAFELSANTTSNLYMQAVSLTAQAVTGSPAVGTFIGYGLPSLAQENRAQLGDGKTRAHALAMGATHAMTDTLANMGTSGKLNGKLMRAMGLDSAIRVGAHGAGKAGATRSFMGMLKLFGKGVAEEYKDEFGDEFKEGGLWQVAGGAVESLLTQAENGGITPSGAVRAIIRDGVMRYNPFETAAELADELPDWTLSMLPMAVMGGMGDAVSGMRDTRRAAAKLAQEGSAQAAAEFTGALSRELADPQNAKAFDSAAQTAQRGETAAAVMMEDAQCAADVEAGLAAKEQADSHGERAQNSQAAMDEAARVIEEKQAVIDAGEADETDVQMVVDAQESIARNKNNLDEATREQAQKEDEAQSDFERAQQTADKKAAARNKELARALIDAAAQERSADRQARLDEARRRYDQARAAFESADLDDMAELERLAEEMGNRLIDLEDLESMPDDAGDAELEAAQAAYDEAQRKPDAQEQAEREAAEQAFEEENRAQERAALSDVLKEIRRGVILINDQQLAEMKNRTGARSLRDINRIYGVRFTRDSGKATRRLDGSSYAELADMSGGYMNGDTLHPETDLLDLLDHMGEIGLMEKRYAQASLGETDREAYLPDGASYGTMDPVTQRLASLLYKKTGLEMVVAPLSNGVRAIYDRANGRILVSTRVGSAELLRMAVMHELTHFCEKSTGYEAYAKAVLDAAYDGDEDAMTRDTNALISRYEEAGIDLSPEDAKSELVAAATERVIRDPDGETLEWLLARGKRSFVRQLYGKLVQFMARRRAKRAGDAELRQYDMMEDAKKRLLEALDARGKWQQGQETGVDPTVEIDAAKRARGEVETDSEQTQMQMALVGRTEDGKGIYASNYSPDTPKQVKIDRLVDLWQTVWSRKPLEMTVTNADGSTRTVTANFDPDYDPENKRFTDLGKVVHNRNGSPGDRTVTLNLAEDLYDIASEAEYYTSEKERGKTTETHKGAKVWHYFSNEFVYRNGDKDTPMTLWIDLKEREDGGWVYQLYAKKTKNKEEASSSPRGISSARGEEAPSDNRVAQSGTAVNPHSMQDSGKQYAVGDVGFRMFGNETAQRLDTLTQQVKDALKGTTYEKDTNADQVDRAQKRIDRDGLDATIDSLLTKPQENWSADEHAIGALCMVLANQTGRTDPIRAMAIAQLYNEQGTKAGKALQVRQIVGKLTPGGAMLGAVNNAKAANEKKGIGKNAIPMGNEAPKGKNRKRAGQSGTTVAPMGDVSTVRGPEGGAVQGSFTQGHPAQIVEDIYDKADRTYADLSTLPQDVSRDNPWNLPLNPAQMALIRQFGLMGEKLPGANYSRASQTQRMLAAIIATPNNVRGDGLLTLCQQLEAMKQGLAVVTEADLNYIAGQASEVLAQGVTEAGTPATVEGRIAMMRMYDTQANTVPATFGQKFTAIRYVNMLSSPATWVRNVASNVLVTPLEKVSTWLASAADAAVAKRTGTRTTAYTTKEERAAGRDAAAQEVVNTVRDHFVTHTDTSHGRKYDTGYRGRTFQSAWLDAYENLVSFAMQIGDRPFYEACYAEELAVIKRLGMKKQEMDGEGRTYMRDMTAEEMHDEATMRALERVFQEDSNIVKMLNGAEGKEKFLLDTLLPFRKTPMNIAKRMFQYSPYGLAKALLVDGLYMGMKNNGKDFDQRKFVMGVGRGLTGSGMMIAGIVLGAAGLLGSGRGDEEDDKLRAMRTALGEPYSMYLKLGDMDVEIEWGLPSTAGLVIGAKLAELVKDAIADGKFDENDLINVIIGTFTDSAELMFDNTYLSAISEIFRGYGDAGKFFWNALETTVENVANQTISPAFIRALAKAIDPYVRDTSSDNIVMEMLNSCVIQYWPGLRQMLPVKTDIAGDKVLQSGYYSWGKEHQSAVLHFMNTFLTPTMPIGEKNDAAILGLVDLSYRSGETSFLPGYLVTSNGKLNLDKDSAKKLGLGDGKHVYPLNLNAEETRRANELYGNILFNGTQGVKYPKATFGSYGEVTGLRELMESRAWERMTDEERIKAVKDAKALAKEIVAVQMARGQME